MAVRAAKTKSCPLKGCPGFQHTVITATNPASKHTAAALHFLGTLFWPILFTPCTCAVKKNM